MTATRALSSYVKGEWIAGGDRQPLLDPTTEDVLAETGTGGIDFAGALAFARERGGPALREMTFAQRGEMLAGMAKVVHDLRDELIELAVANGGNTRGDAKFDIDGAMGTLAFYGELGKSLGATRLIADGEPVRLARSPRYIGRHVLSPLTGVAVHINAFNFPAWGFGEKAALALLAGMPVVTKPATSTALVAERLVRGIIEKGLLPAGALSLLSGSAGDLLDHLTSQDVLAFTGSGATGNMLRGRKNVIEGSIRTNIEADSLNAAILGPDVEPASPTWDLFVRDVVKDMTQKAGQKCTAIRRVLVPASVLAEAREDLAARLADIKVGDPRDNSVRMGPVATRGQLDDVRAGIERLRGAGELVTGDGGRGELVGVREGKGYFVAPILVAARDAVAARAVHEHEVFGPVATLMPHDGAAHATKVIRMGGGGLVSSVYTDDREFAEEMLTGIAPFHGRLNFGSAKVAEHAMGPGAVLPQLTHGGPGRAGGGEELGAHRGMSLYLQRTALQGDEPMLAKILAGAATLDRREAAPPSA